MEEKDLRKMRRSELIEIIYVLKTREEELEQEVVKLQTQLKNRRIQLSKAGSIAEAALALNGVFEAAQAAANDYLKSLQEMHGGGEISPIAVPTINVEMATESANDIPASSEMPQEKKHSEAEQADSQEPAEEYIDDAAKGMKEYVAFYTREKQ